MKPRKNIIHSRESQREPKEKREKWLSIIKCHECQRIKHIISKFPTYLKSKGNKVMVVSLSNDKEDDKKASNGKKETSII